MTVVIVPPERAEEFSALMARLEWLNAEMRRLEEHFDNKQLSASEWAEQNRPFLHESWGVHEKIRALGNK